MIYITGDCHSNFERFNKSIFPEQSEMTKDDYVIICGDFGGVWDKVTESNTEKWWLDWLESKSFTTLFVDGNHENFDRLYDYPVEEWHGGKVHKIRDSVIHLMRGQVFIIDGKKIFTFGGAASHDFDGGILELDDPDFKRKKKILDKG
ncbi:MAG: metallophosphoesterase, partial [Lachnospiraceae bacterium]|nr:metallophosphoesterase [Lachnospiraceae bacterium]